jgi:ADP-heptose:LPS heptosyltransferase
VTSRKVVLVHLASGIGNIVLATPLLKCLAEAGFIVDVFIEADYRGVGELFDSWSAVRTVHDERSKCPVADEYDEIVAAVPPFYWKRYLRTYPRAHKYYRPKDSLFFSNEQAYYLDFARHLGCDITNAPYYFLPVMPEVASDVNNGTLALVPGSKTGTMASKRWPYFVDLAEHFEDVVVVGTEDDLFTFGGSPLRFRSNVRSFVGHISLLQTATVLAGVGAVVANDCGVGHIAGALGLPTILLFGPTPHLTLGGLPPNVTILRAGLSCEPCWHSRRYHACDGTIQCLQHIDVATVVQCLRTATNVKFRRNSSYLSTDLAKGDFY